MPRTEEQKARKRETDRAYRLTHHDSIVAVRKQWRDRNRDRDNATAKLWRSRPEVKARYDEYMRKYRSANREEISARQKVRYALITGRLVMEPCETCGSTRNVDAHHDDYSKPLNVRWLCRRHHKELHAQLLEAP